MRAIERFENDGYLVIANVVAREEAAALRQNVLSRLAEEHRRGTLRSDPREPTLRWFLGDVLSKPGLDHLVFDARILTCVRQLLGPSVAYWGDSFVQIGEGFRNLHKDCVDRLDPQGPDWRGRYTIARFILYLQDNVGTSGGLKVRRGSHRFADFTSGRLVHVKSRLGDLVALKLTTTHAGNAVRMRMVPWLALPGALEPWIPSFLRRPGNTERVGIFLTYGAPGVNLERHVQHYVRGGGLLEHWRHSRGDDHVAKQAEERNVTFWKPTPDYGSLHSR